MAWKNKGKIQYNCPNTTDSGFNVARIVYSRDGVLSNINEIEKVYYISPDAASTISAKTTHEERLAELNKWLVWLRYLDSQRMLVAGDKNVAIEYVPTDDVTINSIEIFTTSNQGNTDEARIKIIHESGLYIASFNGDGKSSSETLYDLDGYKRYISSISVKLYAGKKYYFVYNDASDATSYYPAYFQNELGNYKEYSNINNTAMTTDISTFGTYQGEISDFSDIFNMSENDFFYWTGSTSDLSNSIYVRSNIGLGTVYKGEFGSSQTSLREQDIKAFIDMSINDSFRLMSQNTGINVGSFTYKSSDTPENTTDYGSQTTATLRLALLLMDINLNDETFCVTGPANWEYGCNPADIYGYNFSMATGYSSQVTSLTPLDILPETPVNSGFYFLKNGLVSGMTSDSICLYNNGSWTIIYNYTDLKPYFDRTFITTYMTVIGVVDDLYKQHISDANYISNELRTTPIATPSRKYYLKLNNSIEV